MTLKSIYVGTFTAVSSLLFLVSHQFYSGSYFIYLFFCLTFFTLVVLNWFNNFSYAYFFLSIFLWLGFYLKIVAHLLYSYPYLEPTGDFISTSSSWDDVLLVTCTAALGLISARVLFVYFFKKNIVQPRIPCFVPIIYIKFRQYFRVLLIFLILFFCFINAYFGIHQIGVAPRTILAYPTNAFITYMLNFGLITIASIYLWWDINSFNKVSFMIAIVLLGCLCVSMSIVSRGTFILHLLPILLVLYRFRLFEFNLRSFAILVVSTAILLSSSFFVVDSIRGYLYRAQDVDFRLDSKELINQLTLKNHERNAIDKLVSISPEESSKIKLRELDEEILLLNIAIAKNQSEITNSITISGKLKLITTEMQYQVPAAFSRAVMLLTNRWVGLEGVMSVQAVPNKSFDLFFRGINESYRPNIVPLYQHLSKSIYIGMDPNQWKFGSVPGSTAFLYYSGSFIFIFFGMLVLSILAIFFECLILLLTGNLFLVSIYTCLIANIIAQLGDVPKQNLITLLMLLLTAVTVNILNRFLVYKRL